MAFLPRKQLTELVRFASIADKEIRSDLSAGLIANENDYSSNFTGALRRIINSNSQTGLVATSLLLHAGAERTLGADAAIVLNYGNRTKIAVFEGKWPRFSRPGYRWDKRQKGSGKSHFSEQLVRQARWANSHLAVFEMVYCEYPFGQQPAFLKNEGSSCIWHDDAERFRATHKGNGTPWTQTDLKNLIISDGINLARVIREFGACEKGRAFERQDLSVLRERFELPFNLLSVTAPVNDVRRRIRQ